MISDKPYFSIVIPMYNRKRFVARAIQSCLKQDFDDFEIIIVDDGSTDGSADVVRNFSDPRISLIRQSRNRGAGPARNIGADAARGRWVVCFDSDDEFTNDALRIMFQRAEEAPEEITRIRFMCRYSTGQVSPFPPLQDENIDYKGYICWMEKTFGGLAETLPIVRRSTFESVRYADSRMDENYYHLKFAERFLGRDVPDIVRIYHQDADNQLMKSDAQGFLRMSADMANGIAEIMAKHGTYLASLAPRVYFSHLSGLATQYFLSGRRWRGLKVSARCIRLKPFSMRVWSILWLGLIGPKVLVWAKLKNQRRHAV